jgi:lycopene cyclase domain-containing protein
MRQIARFWLLVLSFTAGCLAFGYLFLSFVAFVAPDSSLVTTARNDRLLAVALALLWYADAFRAAGRTLVVIYPVAFVWDWYSLEVGIFSIPMRTGVELLGIPIEEHVFIVVVVSLVVGIHEALRTYLDSPEG